MPAPRQRVTSLDEIRRMYNKNLTDFKNFEEYQQYMEERTIKVMELKNKGVLEGKKDDAGLSLMPQQNIKPKKKDKRRKTERKQTDDMTVRFQGDGLNFYNPTS